MRFRLFWRRSATAAGVYVSAALGFAATVAAARLLGPRDFGVFAIAIATAAFVQVLLDSTVEEAVVKYGFRYAKQDDLSRLRRLFTVASVVKLAGASLAALVIAAFAPLAGAVFGIEGIVAPLLIAATLPLVQAPEGIAGAALMVRGRYDLRGAFMAVSMAFRLAGIAVGASYGVTEAVAGVVVGQAFASLAVAAAGAAMLSPLLRARSRPLGADRGPLRRFVLHSAATTALVAARASLAPVLVGVVASPVQVGYFRAAQAPMTGFFSLSAPARLILFAEQTSDFEAGRLDRVYRLLGRYVLAAVAAAVAIVPLLWWQMPAVVRLLYGAEFLPAVDAMRLITVAGAIWLVFGWTKSFPVSIGRPDLRILAHGVETAVLVPLIVLLAGPWGATGAAGAMLASTAVFAAVWLVLLVRIRTGHVAARRPAAPSEAVLP
ncbi:MAG TPA: oligosaccharide flippase family protein [Candidatus Limnocylindrales bacterium]|nr:oligosaccharide flippase family protein [Candidatus Limnocylindrales bacterium]